MNTVIKNQNDVNLEENKGLTLEELVGVSGGKKRKSDSGHSGYSCDHKWVRTGQEREGWLFWLWTKHQYEYKCVHCCKTDWFYS
ncbi:MAG: hypothetical protein K5894_11910 [Lachnospiraceae bacterium]|nr:hypothetical protein [Lachnospiraceae bacterium]